MHTKENIANVYGAKTLLALIPLDLTFEMDPPNRFGSTQNARNSSTQEDTGSREVKIMGHISRPVVGEGRQTPDRQMFFVNSRPCNLPQVAKAFNEVYKSYNITQSPFIFADLKLDTNAYDVNVSPDKRSIMLHDQTALLENLKDALGKLFAAHDQSVPQAQLLDRKLSSFKPPVLQQNQNTDSVTDQHSLPSRTPSAYKGWPRPQPEPSVANSSAPAEEGTLPGFVKANLIERFAGRHTEDRAMHKPVRRRKSVLEDNVDTPVPEEQQQEAETDTQAQQERSASPLFEPGTEGTNSARQLPNTVQDFNVRMASQQAKHVPPVRSSMSSELEQNEEGEDQRIPSIKQTPQKRVSQSTIQNAFDRMRPMRTPRQQATITIGDTTVVSTIGSSSKLSRQARIHTPRFSLDGTPLSQKPKQPLFSKSLRGFAAPGTQVEGSDEEEEEEVEDGDADPDSSSMPDALAARTSSPVKRHLTTGTIGSSTDDMYEVSSTPPLPPPLPVDEEEEEEEGEEEEVEESREHVGPETQQMEDGLDDEYIDEEEKKAREEAKIAKMIAEAEEAAARPSEMNLKRASKLFQVSRKKYHTIGLVRPVDTSVDAISQLERNLRRSLLDAKFEQESMLDGDLLSTSVQLDASGPEERLSLTVTKSDFHNMRIIGQFNVGFIIAVRPPSSTLPTADLFIIDQHASDEKYNFERFSSTTVLVSQRLVHPHPLELTAIEEEVILSNEHALSANGFIVSMDTSSDAPVGQRAKLTALPMSKEVTFTLTDLEELLSLLLDNPPSASGSQYIPRPSKVRKLLASRACRSSIMIGKTLKKSQMEKVVGHMGEMDKPWSCPHGRPTMRHLLGMDNWESWEEGDGIVGLGEAARGGKTDWGGYLRRMGAKAPVRMDIDGEAEEAEGALEDEMEI